MVNPLASISQQPRQSLLSAARGLVNAAGGLNFHFTAWRFRKTLWRPYQHAVSRVLSAWAPTERALVIIGPSAGWNLPESFLTQFETVVAVEPDPLARLLLRSRFPRVRWQMDTTDYFTPQGTALWSDNLAALFTRYPTQALLFSEFLGQLVGLYPEAIVQEKDGALVETDAFVRWKAHLRAHLRTRSFCTTHDRWVSAVEPKALPSPPLPFPLEGPPPAALWPDPHVAFDPFTANLTPDVPQRVLLWQRLPVRWHVMVAAWQNAQTS